MACLRVKTSPRRIAEGAVSVRSTFPTRPFHHASTARHGVGQAERRANGASSDRDLLLSVLSSSTTKRDAKAYLQRFRDAPPEPSTGAATAAGAASPLAIVLLRAPDALDDEVLEGVGRTLTQLNRLGLQVVLVLGEPLDHHPGGGAARGRRHVTDQADRLVSLLQREGNARARRLDCVLAADGDGVASGGADGTTTPPSADRVRVEHRRILRDTLRTRTIPVIPPLAYSANGQRRVDVSPEQALLALVEEFADSESSHGGVSEEEGRNGTRGASVRYGVDRIIVLDSAGGLPSLTRPDRSHVFVNLAQEHGMIRRELETAPADAAEASRGAPGKHATSATAALLGEESPPGLAGSDTQARPDGDGVTTSFDAAALPPNRVGHLRNLDLIRRSLARLPPSASALLTTPLEAATLPARAAQASLDLGVITRRAKNPLIVSLLADRPTVSSSLPASRLPRPGSGRGGAGPPAAQVPVTFFKQGMALDMIPNPEVRAWAPPASSAAGGRAGMGLDDPRVDLGRLLALIEDSFGRPLDAAHYLERVRGRVAGIVVAGDYEGGAILTWELPPGVADDGSAASAARMVPYLDKFAVLRRSQGAGGVADIVFSAMVRTCLPGGVCWRSRQDNPVNKWYFERSVGTWRLPGTQWSMFWTTPGLAGDGPRLADYRAVCASIQPSWADRKHVVD